MAATVLNSPGAVKMSVLRHVAAKLTVHDRTLTSILKAIRSLTESPATSRRPIGFTADLSEKE